MLYTTEREMFINDINFGGMNSSIHVGWVVLLSTQKRRNIVRDGKKVTYIFKIG